MQLTELLATGRYPRFADAVTVWDDLREWVVFP
jgi:hypothetical protein